MSRSLGAKRRRRQVQAGHLDPNLKRQSWQRKPVTQVQPNGKAYSRSRPDRDGYPYLKHVCQVIKIDKIPKNC